jgi:UDP-glucose 4-epimerase
MTSRAWLAPTGLSRLTAVRYLITGGSGYIGSRLVEQLIQRDDVERVVIADLRAPKFRPKTAFAQLDVRDRAACRELLERERPDALVHLAFILNPSHDEAAAYAVDVGGTQNVLEAAAEADIGQVLVTSSSVAYGAFPDNPVPLTEEHPVRGVAEFSYAVHKTESDRLCQLWALQHPERVMTIVRPCIVYGPTVDNYLVRIWSDQPFQPDFGGDPNPVQFVHEDDVVSALITLLEGRHAGAFNVAADGTMTGHECADIVGMSRVRMPFGAFRAFLSLMWKLRRSEAPPGSLAYSLNPWVVSNEKLKRETGWQPRYTSRETFELTMRARGVLHPDAPAEAPPERVPTVV